MDRYNSWRLLDNQSEFFIFIFGLPLSQFVQFNEITRQMSNNNRDIGKNSGKK